MCEQRLEALRMLRARARRRSLLHPDDDRNAAFAAGDVANVRGLIDELVESDEHEVGPHDLDDWPHTLDRCSDRRPEDRALRDRCVEDAVCAELVLESACASEDSAGEADILSVEQELRTKRQFVAKRAVDGLPKGQLLAASSSGDRSRRRRRARRGRGHVAGSGLGIAGGRGRRSTASLAAPRLVERSRLIADAVLD